MSQDTFGLIPPKDKSSNELLNNELINSFSPAEEDESLTLRNKKIFNSVTTGKLIE